MFPDVLFGSWSSVAMFDNSLIYVAVCMFRTNTDTSGPTGIHVSVIGVTTAITEVHVRGCMSFLRKDRGSSRTRSTSTNNKYLLPRVIGGSLVLDRV